MPYHTKKKKKKKLKKKSYGGGSIGGGMMGLDMSQKKREKDSDPNVMRFGGTMKRKRIFKCGGSKLFMCGGEIHRAIKRSTGPNGVL